MKALMQPLQELAGFEELQKGLSRNRGLLSVSGCLESQKAHLIAGVSQGGTCRLMIAENELKAKELYEDFRLYDPEVLLYPAKDLIFYQADIQGNLLTQQRMRVVQAILERKNVSIITSTGGCMDYLLPLRVLKKHVLTLQNDSELDVDWLKEELVRLGYERCAQVEGPGEFSIRGGIVDIYSLTEEYPFRIELWGDEVDSIRSFDVESQRSIENLEQITIYPAAEQLLEEGQKEAGRRGSAARATDTFLDYLPQDAVIFLDEPNRILESAKSISDEFCECMKQRMEQKLVKAEEVPELMTPEQLAYVLNRRNLVSVSLMEPKTGGFDVNGKFSVTVKSVNGYNNQFSLLIKDIRSYKRSGYRMVLLSPSRTRAARLAEEISSEGIPAFFSEDESRELEPGEVMVIRGNARRGFEYPLQKFVLITETDIFGKEVRKKKRKKQYSGKQIQDFAELSVGDFVVHESHGLGVYRGIEKVEIDHVVKDYMKIEYAGGSNLYIQATQLDALQKYAGADAKKPKLNRLGGQEWNKTKSRVRGAVKNIARELVQLYAVRQQTEGYQFGKDTVWQREFEEMFPFEETDDQLNAIEAVKEDMESRKIMDRLVCGDVGYGKTEVAIRAAFKAVQDSKQVVFLVPTTILAQQHYNTFVQRMKDFPVRVDLMCRFRTPAEQKKTVQDLKKGLVDIVIGTHRVLSKDMEYKDLGLLIIDEEQRFGVAHKEKIKELKKDVDVLTLTATPIPRTLHMSLIGIRDMSVLEEPPHDRLPIQTYVMEFNEEMVREAVSRELARGGQVYYVYNRVNDIVDLTNRIARLVPEANVGFAHGQMKERELEKIMYSFISGEIDVLVTTTIIETGLDISNANTMIIHDADKMGLSQLYQLRGRVGRSNRTAYAFLLYKRDKMLKEIAEKRLHAIREFSELGSGFKIAMRDLELRGAGNLLGAEQHGHMEAVGYDLYCKMLSEAVKEAKGIPQQEEFETTVDLELDAYIPERYIPNENQKLDIYKRIAGIENDAEYENMLEELMDRFGEPPKSVQNLLAVARLKAAAHQVYLVEIKQRGNSVKLTLHERAKLNPQGIPAVLEAFKGELSFKMTARPYFLYEPARRRSGEQIAYLERTLGVVQMLKKSCS